MRTRDAGFSLIELLIAMVVLVEVMAAVLLLFTSLSDLARVQTEVAEMHQVQRVGQRSMIEHIREAGRGGLPLADGLVVPPPADQFPGIALTVLNDTQPNTRIAGGSSDFVMPGTDVLIVRGVFDTPVYYKGPQEVTRVPGDPVTSLLEGAASPFTLNNEILKIHNTFFTYDRFSQSLDPLIDALAVEDQRVLLVRDVLNPGAYALIETDGIANPFAVCGQCIDINVGLTSVTDAPKYAKLMNGSGIPGNAGYRVQLGSAAVTVGFPRLIGAVGMLQEFRYYLRPDPSFDALDPQPDHSIPLATGGVMPAVRLSRLEVRPGTDDPIGSPVDIADNVVDLQFAIGIDTSNDCPPSCSPAAQLQRGAITDDGSDTDEVLFNHEDDVFNGFAPGAGGVPEIHFVRVTTLVLGSTATRGFRARPIPVIEDADRTQDIDVVGVTFNLNTGLLNYRRRLMQTVVDLRNTR